MSDQDANKTTFDKGDRAAIVAGHKSVGVRGSVFWIGENKYGPGMRYGLRGDDGETYWVDESQIGSEANAPAPPPGPPATPRDQVETFDKGDRVRITGGKGRDEEGEVFWIGESKYGKGMRYGVRAGEDETYWVDEAFLERAKTASPAAATPARQADDRPSPPRQTGDRPSPPKQADDLPPEAFEQYDDLPPEAYDQADELPPEAFDDGEEPPR